jgi:hypothetical protein
MPPYDACIRTIINLVTVQNVGRGRLLTPTRYDLRLSTAAGKPHAALRCLHPHNYQLCHSFTGISAEISTPSRLT